MSKIDKQLTGSNFCGLDCTDKQKIIHPETCVNNIVLSNESSRTLDDWVSYYSTEEPPSEHMSFSNTNGLLEWLQYNYPTNSANIPIASTSTLGGVIIDDTYLNINTSTGLLGIKLSSLKEGLDIPTLDIASFSNEGTIKLGNATTISAQFSTSSITETISPIPTLSDNTAYSFPVRIDVNDRAGITIPTKLFAQQQVDWNQTTSTAPDYIKNKPELADVATTGDYDDLLNKPEINTYTAGDNISISSSNEISANYNIFSQSNNGLVPAPTSSDTNKYLKGDGTWYDPRYNNTKLWTSCGLSDHYFRIEQTLVYGASENAPKHVPLFKIKINTDSRGDKASHLFEITSRLDHNYYNKFLINYYKEVGSVEPLTNNLLKTVNIGNDNSDVVAYINNNVITVYRKYTSIASCPDTFIVSILGQNNPNYTIDNVHQNEYTYYCTASYDGDTVITSSEIITGTPSGTKLIDLPTQS